MPSRLISRNTVTMLHASFAEGSDGNMPTVDSNVRVRNMITWIIAGREMSRVGRAGTPREMDDRERNTVVW